MLGSDRRVSAQGVVVGEGSILSYGVKIAPRITIAPCAKTVATLVCAHACARARARTSSVRNALMSASASLSHTPTDSVWFSGQIDSIPPVSE
jgi:hypothetical protein